MTEYTRENMPDDLKLLAERATKWKAGANAVQVMAGEIDWLHKSLSDLVGLGDVCFTETDLKAARQTLGLGQPEYVWDDNALPTEEEEEEWQRKVQQQPAWARSVPEGVETHAEGRKFDADKPMMDLIPPFMEEEVAKVLTFGAQKYSPGNWRNVEPLRSRYLAAAQRHINALKKGEATDPESGLHHAAHAVCCLMFLGEVELEE